MSTKLVFIGGPPGVGKSEVAGKLFTRLHNCVWLEGDDIWRMNPFLANDCTKNMVERNIRFLLGSYIESGFSYVLFTWVLHCDEVVNSLLMELGEHKYEFRHFTLLCDEDTLRERIAADAERTTDVNLALQRLVQARQVTSNKINTTNKSPDQIAKTLIAELVV
ncbi:MAG: AAA family ATPase [candidate division Zixibacteria bacterium]|nr:AAA family ATPase [candidate division Zixibacteria bacterium]